MKPLHLAIALPIALAAALLPSCKKPEETIRGRVVILSRIIRDPRFMPHDPVGEGLPVSIFRDDRLYTVAHTDTGGHFQFSTTEFSNEELQRFSATFLKRGPFDSTLAEWRYINDTTYLRHASQWGAITEPTDDRMRQRLYFSHLEHLVFDPGLNQFRVVPSGWLLLRVLNHSSEVSVRQYQNFHTQIYSTDFGDMAKPFMLIPGRTYEFQVNHDKGLGSEYLFSFSHHVRNSIDPGSTPGNVRLVPDTLIIDMQTRTVEAVRAVF